MVALTACGGGGGGSYSAPTPPPASAPTVSFAQPGTGTAIILGQAVTVVWQSANATSCTATASSAAAGAFTGSQGLAGGMPIAPTAAGSYTYSVSCTGAGGTTSASSASVTVKPNILSTLAPTGTIPTVGSTIDPVNGDQNPYGLTIATATAGLITQGDLIVCNFNNAGTTANAGGVQGTGTTIIGLHPGTGSVPYRIAQSADLLGCNALATLSDGSIAAASWASNMNPLVSATGAVGTPFSDAFAAPWGEAYVPAKTVGTSDHLPAALYISNAPGSTAIAAGGTLDRISFEGDAQTPFVEIATGFCTSGAPGGIYGPAGLTYDPASDTLYIVDTSSASVIAIAGVSSLTQDGVVVNGQCTATSFPTPVPTFSGPQADHVTIIAHGAPLSTPLSATLLQDGDLLVANADIGVNAPSSATNLLIEISPVLPGGFVGNPLQVDNGTPGALFGLAATVDANGNQIVYFNDDNASAVMQLSAAPPASTTPPATGY